jgi:hypothetical protein
LGGSTRVTDQGVTGEKALSSPACAICVEDARTASETPAPKTAKIFLSENDLRKDMIGTKPRKQEKTTKSESNRHTLHNNQLLKDFEAFP